MATAEGRIWRTPDGQLLAAEVGPSGATLAYAPGDELADEDAKTLKARAKPQDKARTKADGK